jgi:CubicO group peptidase (beta-lactamase class C family)
MNARTVALALSLVLALHTSANGQSPPSVTSDTATARLRAGVDSIFARYNGTDRPECAVGVSRNGTVLLERGYGMADLESGRPITPETIFESGSVAKQFVAATMLLLEQSGRLSLDDALRRHLPELPAWADSITLRQMLGHTSGLRDQWELFEIQGRPLGVVAHRLGGVLELARKQRGSTSRRARSTSTATWATSSRGSSSSALRAIRSRP